MKKPQATREDAMKIARYLGCRGAHQRPDGNWVPCSDEETLMRLSSEAEGKAAKKKKKKKEEDDGWENLDEGGIVGIDTLPDGSLVSAQIGMKRVILPTVSKAIRREIAKTELQAQKLLAETKGDASTTRSSGKVSAEVEKTLKAKVTTHNKRMKDLNKPEWSMTNVGQLRSVFLRGAGAYKTSHRPGTTQTQWALARVNAFLRILSSGRPDNLKYMSDADLLPESHPWRKRVGTKALRRPASFDPNAVDGDNDGRVQDSTQFERPATPRAPRSSTGQARRSMTTTVSPAAQSAGPNDKRKRFDLPDYFKEIRYSPASPMVDKPTRTDLKFSQDGKYSAERIKNVHRRILDSIIGTPKKRGKDRKDKKMWVLGGSPGSYKSSLRREGFMGMPGRTDAAHIDPDEIKEMIPEFQEWINAGERGAANEVHHESRDIMKAALAEAYDEGLDIVYDTSGQFGRGGQDLERARDAGYKVVAHYTTGDVDQFLKGVEQRAQATGRYIPAGKVEEISAKAPGYAEEMLGKGLFDEFYLWDTTNQGERVLVAVKLSGQDLQVLDDAMFRRWKNGGR